MKYIRLQKIATAVSIMCLLASLAFTVAINNLGDKKNQNYYTMIHTADSCAITIQHTNKNAILYILSQNNDELEEYYQGNKYFELLDELETKVYTDEDLSTIQQLMDDCKNLQSINEQAFAYVADGDTKSAVKLINSEEYKDSSENSSKNLEQLDLSFRSQLRDFHRNTEKASKINFSVLCSSLILLILMLIVRIIQIKRTNDYVDEVLNVALEVSNGNFDVNLSKHKNYMSEEYSKFINNIMKIVYTSEKLVSKVSNFNYEIKNENYYYRINTEDIEGEWINLADGINTSCDLIRLAAFNDMPMLAVRLLYGHVIKCNLYSSKFLGIKTGINFNEYLYDDENNRYFDSIENNEIITNKYISLKSPNNEQIKFIICSKRFEDSSIIICGIPVENKIESLLNDVNFQSKTKQISQVEYQPVLINRKDGISRFGGKEDRYDKALHSFIEKYHDVPKCDDNEDFRRYIHTVKGVAGNLGIAQLFKTAQKLEKDLDNITLFSEFRQIFDDVAKQVGEMKAVSSSSKKAIIEKETIECFNLIQKLKTSISDYNPLECEQTIDEIISSKWKNVSNSIFDNLSKAIDNYDFDLASEITDRISADLEKLI